MDKKLKFAYFALMAINGIMCVVDIIMSNYTGATVCGITLAWLINTYFLADNLHLALADIERLYKKLQESDKREKLHHQEFAKMRERAQNAEKQLQQMIDDTPARGEDGRYVKRG